MSCRIKSSFYYPNPKVAETLLTELREAIPVEQIEAALEHGKGMEVDAVVAELLE